MFYRYERLEEQLNDLTELHQNEMTNLKQELASMEEKVAYQSYERARDIQVQIGVSDSQSQFPGNSVLANFLAVRPCCPPALLTPPRVCVPRKPWSRA